MKKAFALIFKGTAFYVSLGTLLQMFLAGIWHAGVVSTPEAHVFFGLSMLAAALIGLIAAAVSGQSRAVIGQAGLLFFLILLQPFLIEARRNGLPLVSAFHTLNAPFIGIVAGGVLAQARGGEKEGQVEGEVAPAAGD